MKFKMHLLTKSGALPSSNPFLLIFDKLLNFPFSPWPMVECPLPYGLQTVPEIRTWCTAHAIHFNRNLNDFSFPFSKYNILNCPLRACDKQPGCRKWRIVNGKIKGKILYSLFMKGLCSEVMKAVALLCFYLQNSIKSNRTYRVHKPLRTKPNFHLSSFDFLKLHQQKNQVEGGHWFYGASNR